MIGDAIRDRFGQAAMDQVMDQAVDSGAIDELCTILATHERRNLEKVATLHDALDVDYIEDIPEVEDRKGELKDTIKALPSGDLPSVYTDRVLSERLDTTDGIDAYLGMGTDSEEWQEQVATWAEHWRERGDFSDHHDRQLAHIHVNQKWGVNLDEFEANVVGFDEADCAKRILTGNLSVIETGLDAAIEAVEEGVDSV